MNHGLALYRSADYPGAEDSFLAGLKIASQKPANAEFEPFLLLNLAITNYEQGLLEKAMSYAESALEVFQQSDKKLGEVAALEELGNVYRVKGRFSDANNSYSLALSILNANNARQYRQYDVKQYKVRIYNNIGLIQLAQGRNEEAEKSLQQALDLAKEVKDLRMEAVAGGNIGILYRKTGNLDEAWHAHLTSLEIYIALGDVVGQATAQANIGDVHLASLNVEEALKHHVEAFELLKLTNHKTKASAANKIGADHHLLRNTEKALAFHRIALGYASIPEEKAIALANIGFIYSEQGEKKLALQNLTEAKAIYETYGFKDRIDVIDSAIAKLSNL